MWTGRDRQITVVVSSHEDLGVVSQQFKKITDFFFPDNSAIWAGLSWAVLGVGHSCGYTEQVGWLGLAPLGPSLSLCCLRALESAKAEAALSC